jgi:hypothetical protein
MSDTIKRVLAPYGRNSRIGLDDLNKVVIIPRRQIWVWIPKNAGGSIARQLMETYGKGAIATDMSFDDLYGLNPALRDFETVAFQRNPYTRIVSCWLNKIADDDGWVSERYPQLKGMSFGDFAKWLNTEEGNDENADPHWRSQREFFIGVHKRLKFESIKTEIAYLGLDSEALPHRNSHQKMSQRIGVETRPLTDWYDYDSFLAIRERYYGDIKWMRYSFPGETPKSPAELAAVARAAEEKEQEVEALAAMAEAAALETRGDGAEASNSFETAAADEVGSDPGDETPPPESRRALS